MARTHRTHISPAKLAKRGGNFREDDTKPPRKTHKQTRGNERAKIRKEYL